jgi:O-antigen ligase
VNLRRVCIALLVLFAFLTPYIAPAYNVFGLLAVLWLADAIRRRPGFAFASLPAKLAALLAACIALSTLFSRDPKISVRHLAGVSLLLLLPIATDLCDSPTRARAVCLAIAGSGIVISVVGFWQFAHGGNDLGNRITANLSHYMTFSGLTMISGCVLLGFAFEANGRWRAVGLAAVVPLGAMLLTFTRNAYVGTVAALIAYLALRRPRGLLLLPPALLLLFWLLPGPIRDRVRSIGDLEDPSNRDRVSMVKAGGRMIRDFPVFGLGPDMVKPYYVLYREPDAARWRVPHLHNNALQLAAASGVFAALAYLALAAAVLARTGRLLRSGSPHGAAPLLAGVWLASVALFVAGLFEYNFGDTEIEMATLVLWAIPFGRGSVPEPPPRSD